MPKIPVKIISFRLLTTHSLSTFALETSDFSYHKVQSDYATAVANCKSGPSSKLFDEHILNVSKYANQALQDVLVAEPSAILAIVAITNNPEIVFQYFAAIDGNIESGECIGIFFQASSLQDLEGKQLDKPLAIAQYQYKRKNAAKNETLYIQFVPQNRNNILPYAEFFHKNHSDMVRFLKQILNEIYQEDMLDVSLYMAKGQKEACNNLLEKYHFLKEGQIAETKIPLMQELLARSDEGKKRQNNLLSELQAYGKSQDLAVRQDLSSSSFIFITLENPKEEVCLAHDKIRKSDSLRVAILSYGIGLDCKSVRTREGMSFLKLHININKFFDLPAQAYIAFIKRLMTLTKYYNNEKLSKDVGDIFFKVLCCTESSRFDSGAQITIYLPKKLPLLLIEPYAATIEQLLVEELEAFPDQLMPGELKDQLVFTPHVTGRLECDPFSYEYVEGNSNEALVKMGKVLNEFIGHYRKHKKFPHIMLEALEVVYAEVALRRQLVKDADVNLASRIAQAVLEKMLPDPQAYVDHSYTVLSELVELNEKEIVESNTKLLEWRKLLVNVSELEQELIKLKQKHVLSYNGDLKSHNEYLEVFLEFQQKVKVQIKNLRKFAELSSQEYSSAYARCGQLFMHIKELIAIEQGAVLEIESRFFSEKLGKIVEALIDLLTPTLALKQVCEEIEDMLEKFFKGREELIQNTKFKNFLIRREYSFFIKNNLDIVDDQLPSDSRDLGPHKSPILLASLWEIMTLMKTLIFSNSLRSKGQADVLNRLLIKLKSSGMISLGIEKKGREKAKVWWLMEKLIASLEELEKAYQKHYLKFKSETPLEEYLDKVLKSLQEEGIGAAQKTALNVLQKNPRLKEYIRSLIHELKLFEAIFSDVSNKIDADKIIAKEEYSKSPALNH